MPFALQQVVDAGDIACNPFIINEAISQIEAGADELAVFRLPAPGPRPTRGAFRLLGRIPVADYPVSVATAPVLSTGCPGGPRAPSAKSRFRPVRRS